jgi:cellulose synthase/poly-beta-1,6-N-acetylglucosamine synthase-like glycosyltransferase
MMPAAEILFWTSLFLIVYAYVLYPVVLLAMYLAAQAARDVRYLFLGQRDRRRREVREADLPTISIIVPVYNEAGRVIAKLDNIREMEYPRDKVEVLFVSDCSTDGSNELLAAVPDANFRFLPLAARKGKANALNAAVAAARNEILIMSDTSSLAAPDGVRKLVRHFADPSIGLVCATLSYSGSPEFRQTEGVYWNYESMLRIMESRLGATLTASGPFYAMRRALFRPLPPDTLIDDLVVALDVRRAGYGELHDPEVVVIDTPASSVKDEFIRRVRLATGSFRVVPQAFRSRLRGMTLFAFFSHKLLRWILPFLFITLLLSSLGCWLGGKPLYGILFAAQLAFYAWAAAGYLFRERLQHARAALLAYFIVVINLAYLVGFARSWATRSDGTWKRVN